MRMAELSRRSEVPVPTIKYYLREGLLPTGVRTGRNQADYTEDHLRRLTMIRALRNVGGLSVTAVRDVLAAVDADGPRPHQVFRVAQEAIAGPGLEEDSAEARAAFAEVDELIARMGWRIAPTSPARGTLARLLHDIRRAGDEGLLDTLDERAEIAEQVAELDLRTAWSRPDLAAQVRTVVVGTVLGDALATTLRRLAQQHVSLTGSGRPDHR
ncbi:MerR family transcriptional regulator [Georgenia deserti]|uniref:MerR family transcriptional regulator n=1 Tax=Georgenia deserti TaxID=2093781 RepID=A0ABW4L6M5_9MICO